MQLRDLWLRQAHNMFACSNKFTLNKYSELYVCACASIPGGGNVLNVQRTVSQLIASGAKGCFLEDQEWPKRAGHMRGKEVISMEEFAAKVRICNLLSC